jgi:ribose-phosphate pyrophosphokinase
MLNHEIKVFSGTSNEPLAGAICHYLGIECGKVNIEPFPDGEMFIKLEEDVRGKDCFVVQSSSAPVDKNLMEMLIYLDCLRRASATRTTAVMPYFGYARQDRKDAGRVPITAKLVANLITTAGADRVLAVDLHAGQLQGFFDIPLDHLTAEPVLSKYIRTKEITDLTVVAPDVGNMKTASKYASILGGELAIIHKRRISGRDVECTEIIGDVKGRNVLMCDDMISTAGTICGAAELAKERGAKSITIGATHGILVGQAVERLQKAPIDEIIVTDTIPLNDTAAKLSNIKVLSVSELLGEAIRRIHEDESISSMFNGED